MKKYTREQLIMAMKLYNEDFVNNPEKHENLDTTALCAERQIDTLLNFID